MRRQQKQTEVTIWASFDGGLPRRICALTYEQWRCGREIPRLSVLEWGEVHPRVFPPVPLYDRLRGLLVRLRGILRGLGDRGVRRHDDLCCEPGYVCREESCGCWCHPRNAVRRLVSLDPRDLR